MEKRKIIMAENEFDFSKQLNEATINTFSDVVQNGIGNVVAIQFREIPRELVEGYIDSFYRKIDGKYLYKGNFITRNKLYEEIKKYCFEISISIVPKTFDKGYIGEKEYRGKFGYINYTETKLIYKKGEN